MCMDFRGLVSKRVWKITVFGLKPGQDLKSWAAHPHQEFLNVSYPPPPTPAQVGRGPSSLGWITDQNLISPFLIYKNALQKSIDINI